MACSESKNKVSFVDDTFKSIEKKLVKNLDKATNDSSLDIATDSIKILIDFYYMLNQKGR